MSRRNAVAAAVTAADAAAGASLQLQLSAEQGGLIITALAEQPFKLVYELIGKLNGQSNGGAALGRGVYLYRLEAAEACLILEVLAQLPYQQVHQLIHLLQSQLQSQLNSPLHPQSQQSDSDARRRKGKR